MKIEQVFLLAKNFQVIPKSVKKRELKLSNNSLA
jgi:hypothetical protein